jgi:hypothetical protein
MSEPIEETYFNWLSAKVMPLTSYNYQGLLLVLHRTEFFWTVLGDDNREADALKLRLDFLAELNLNRDPAWFDSPVSVLEILIVLAMMANFQTDIPVSDWFWKFIENLRLDGYRRVSEADVAEIQLILQQFITRTYRPNGDGGLFPMHSAPRDQTKVELWYQFCDYVQEQSLI